MLRKLILTNSLHRPRFKPCPSNFSTTPIPEDPSCDPQNPQTLRIDQVKKAAQNIENGVMCTEFRHSYRLSKHLDMDLYLKMELNQVTGSFKERGARNALLNLNPAQRKAGVWAASAGNHALALCYHGGKLGIPINVVMPRHAPLTKIDFCSKLGANIMVKGKDISVSREIALEKARSDPNAIYINGYDHPDILAGAGTVAVEMMEQIKDLDAILIPVGGGGLIAGMAIAIKDLNPNIQVIGIESEACPSFSNSLKQKKPFYTPANPSLADGLAVPLVGCNAFETAKSLIDKTITVSEGNIALAILRLVEWEKVISEGAGATGVAALLSDKCPELKGKRVACVLTGGNIDSNALGLVIERGLVSDTRLCLCNVLVSDRPGGIAELTSLISKCGANIKDLSMNRTWLKGNVFSVMANVTVETRNIDHAHELQSCLVERYGKEEAQVKMN